ncbi:MAG: O-antigen ligase family protein [Chlamydiota bacterium]
MRWSQGSVLVPLSCGLLAAIAVAWQTWPLLAVMAAVPFILLGPVEFAFGLLALAVPFDTVTMLGRSSMTLSFLVSAVSGAVLLAKTLAGRRLARPPRAALWFVLFSAWTAMSTWWAIDPALSTQRLPGAVALVALYLVAVSMVITRHEFRWITGAVVLGGTLAAMVSLYQLAQGVNVAGRASIVFGSLATNPNELAASLILPLALAIAGVLSTRGGTRTLLVVATGLMLLCTLLTMSRGGLAAIGVAAAVFLYRRGMDKRLLAVLVCAALFLLIAPDLFKTRMEEALASRGQGRLDIWLVGVEVVKHNGLLGVGLDNFPLAFSRYAGYQAVFRSFSMAPHNIYLQALAETGVLGLLLLAAALWAQTRELAAAKGASVMVVACEAAAWGIMTHAMVANLLWRKVFWFVWIVAAIAVQLARSEAVRVRAAERASAA